MKKPQWTLHLEVFQSKCLQPRSKPTAFIQHQSTHNSKQFFVFSAILVLRRKILIEIASLFYLAAMWVHKFYTIFKRKWQGGVIRSRKFLTVLSDFFVFFLFPSLSYSMQLRKLPTSLLKDKRIKHSPFYRHPAMTCKISCLQSEKSENAVQRGHRCPRIYLSGQFLKVHLKKYTFVKFTPTQTI